MGKEDPEEGKRGKTFKGVQKKGEDAPLDTNFPGHIGGPNVPAPPLGDIYVGDPFADEFSKWNRANKIGGNGKEDPVIWNEI